MQKLAPFADDIKMHLNMKANNYLQSITIGYALSLILSLIFQNIQQCSPSKQIQPLTYVIYVTNCICAFARTVLSSSAFKKFNPMTLLFAIVITFICIVLTIIIMATGAPWVDIVLGIVFIIVICFHMYLLWKIFQRLTKLQ